MKSKKAVKKAAKSIEIPPFITKVDIGTKWGRCPDTHWTWHGYVDSKHQIMSDDIRDCLKFLREWQKLLPKPIKDRETGI